MSNAARIRVGETVVAIFTLSLGAFIGIQTWMAPSTPAQAVVGPGMFPAIVSAAMILVGLRLLYEAFARRFMEEEHLELDWKATLIVAAAFASQFFLLERLGWIVSGTLLFVVSAFAFGSRAHVRNVLFGLAMTVITYVVFDYGLDLSLPTGSLFENLIGAEG